MNDPASIRKCLAEAAADGGACRRPIAGDRAKFKPLIEQMGLKTP